MQANTANTAFVRNTGHLKQTVTDLVGCLHRARQREMTAIQKESVLYDSRNRTPLYPNAYNLSRRESWRVARVDTCVSVV